MISSLLTVLLVTLTFLFADSVLTPLLLLLSKKIWLLALKAQVLLTKKNVVQALAQSLLLAAKALVRLVNKTVTTWILPLLLTRRQRYWLHHALGDRRRTIRRSALRLRVRWRRQPAWIKAVALVPALVLLAALFAGTGVLLAGVFGLSFIVPWIGGLPIAAVLFFRRAFARLGLFALERLGIGVVVNKVVDKAIDLIWWRTPEPAQQRFDAWWRRFKLRLRRRVIGPRRQVIMRVARLRRGRRGQEPVRENPGQADPAEPCLDPAGKR